MGAMKPLHGRIRETRHDSRLAAVTVLLTAIFGPIVGGGAPAAAHPLGFTATDIDVTASAAQSVATGDIDGDGDLDLASASALDSTIAWYENTAGNGSAWTFDQVATSANAAASVDVGDLDGDGDLDLASASTLDDTIA